MKNKNVLVTLFTLIGMIFIMPFAVFAQEEPVEEESTSVEVLEEVPEEVSETVDTTEAEIVPPEQEELQVEELTDENESENDEELATISDFGEAVPALTIQVEQLAWNQYLLRPSSRIGVTDAEYVWRLGDGSEAATRVVDHTYDQPGTFTVELGVIDEQGRPQMATVQLSVGFFHLANWRLWVLIGLLSLIIILAAVAAGVTDSLVSEPKKEAPIKQPEPSNTPEPLQTHSEETGDLDMMATTGMDSAELSDELALLESLDNTVAESQPDTADMADPFADLEALDPPTEAVKVSDDVEEVPEIQPLGGETKEQQKAKPKKKTSSKKKAASKKKSTQKTKSAASKKKTSTKKKKKATAKKSTKKNKTTKGGK